MPSLHQLRWHNSLRDVKMSVCAWLYYVRTKMQQNDNRWSSISCFISKMIFINFGFYNSLLCVVVSVLMFFVTLLFSQSMHGSRWKGSIFFYSISWNAFSFLFSYNKISINFFLFGCFATSQFYPWFFPPWLFPPWFFPPWFFPPYNQRWMIWNPKIILRNLKNHHGLEVLKSMRKTK